jgi:uncharacterized RDD family membrane protein YckC
MEMTSSGFLRNLPHSGTVHAGFVSRLVAFLIDLALIVAVITVTGAVSTWLYDVLGLGSATRLLIILVTFVFNIAFCLAVYVVCTAAAGQTPGKWIMGIRVVTMNGQPMSVRRALRRLVGQVLSLPLFWGFLIVLIDDGRRSFADKFAGTRVIYDRR